ncbi:monovalent cation/H(+) antiporter subunit G [Henriciella aquimarina]|uniref:monovalent cation/H(+) antiporter subunit G n=1 Tax=Henriciella aquimarina TaxID=545261 RepID=UPI000A022068|nr:monovalent cation/H(+) antiporter subunit G [Henriciella aquimarina]
MGELLGFLMAAKPVLGAFLCLVGGTLAIIGTVGVLRFPDFYTRLHAASVTDTGAATITIIGMALLAPSWLVVFKLAAIWLFLFLTGPTGTHALANAAHTAGLQPVIGRQRDLAEHAEEDA